MIKHKCEPIHGLINHAGCNTSSGTAKLKTAVRNNIDVMLFQFAFLQWYSIICFLPALAMQKTMSNVLVKREGKRLKRRYLQLYFKMQMVGG